MDTEKSFNKENMTRRTFLKKAGLTFLVVSFGGLTWRAIDQGVFSTGKGPAYEPWNISKENRKEGPLALVNDAILASNPHNTQPWLFKVTDSSIELYADESRNLGAIDPLRREMYLGLGCAIENLILSAQAHGYHPRLVYKPNMLEPYCIARVELDPGRKMDSSLYRSIVHRHTDRGPYDIKQTIPTNSLKEMENLVIDEKNVRLSWFTTKEQKQTLGEIIIESTEAIINDKEMSTTSNKWFKETWQDLHESRDGLTLDVQGGSFLVRAMAKILPPLSHENNDKFWLAATKNTQIATAAAYGLISVKNSSDHEQKARAGRAWQRIHLYGASQGMAMQPLNQLNEISDREKSLGEKEYFGSLLKKITGEQSWEGVFIFRLGYPLKKTFQSPRRSVQDVII